nr:hypothetical protein [Novosphingobium sp. NBM11]
MSGRLGISCPIAASAGPSAASRVPARTRAECVEASCPASPAMRSSESIVPDVGTSAVKLCPAPTGRIGVGAAGSACTSSDSLAGARRRSG